MSRYAVLAVMLVSACGVSPVSPFNSPSVRGGVTPEVFEVMIDRDNGVSFDGFSFPSVNYGPVALDRMPVCDAVKIVINSGLAIPVTCSASGSLAFYTATVGGQSIFDLFVRSLRDLGLGVIVSKSGVVVSGGEDDDRNAVYDAQVSGMADNAAGDAIFEGLLEPLERTVGQFSIKMPDVKVITLSGSDDLEAAQELVERLGIGAKLIYIDGRIRAVGKPVEIDALKQVFESFDNVVVPVQAGGGTSSALVGLRSGYPRLSFDYDEPAGMLWISGNRSDVIKAYSLFSNNVPAAAQLRVNSVFVSNVSRVSKVLNIDLMGGVALGSGLSASVGGFGGGDGLTLKAVIDASRSDSQISIISEPSVTVYSGKSAVFKSGDQVPYFGSFDADGVRSVEYRDTGVSVSVSPTLRLDGTVYLKLFIEIVGIGQASGVDGNPVFTTRSVSTELRVKRGQVIALSGFKLSDAEMNKGDRFFFLPDNLETKSREEAIFFVSVEEIN